jgi:hypothetical protein
VILACLISAWLAAGVLGFAAVRPGYSHIRDTISELGETGARHARWMTFGIFLPVGVGCAWISVYSPDARALAGCLAAGYLGGVMFPCDPGSPLDSSWRQALHNLAGGVEYFGGGIALQNSGLSGLSAAVLILALFIAIPQFRLRGLAQRIAECALFGSLCALA